MTDQVDRNRSNVTHERRQVEHLLLHCIINTFLNRTVGPMVAATIGNDATATQRLHLPLPGSMVADGTMHHDDGSTTASFTYRKSIASEIYVSDGSDHRPILHFRPM